MTILRFALMFALLVLLTGNLLAETTSLETIVEKVEMRQSRTKEEIKDAVFLAETIYEERGKDGELKKELKVRKRVYMNRDGESHDEYIGMILNGSELRGKELEKEIKDWKKKAGRQQESKMPLTPEGEGVYEYYLIGDGVWKDMSVWIIGFRPKEEEDGLIVGKGYISKDSFDVVRVEFAPAKTSRVVKDMNMALTYSEIDGYWMPVKFDFSMKIKIGFMVDLFYRTIRIEETYSDHKFNSQLEDSIFESR